MMYVVRDKGSSKVSYKNFNEVGSVNARRDVTQVSVMIDSDWSKQTCGAWMGVLIWVSLDNQRIHVRCFSFLTHDLCVKK